MLYIDKISIPHDQQHFFLVNREAYKDIMKQQQVRRLVENISDHITATDAVNEQHLVRELQVYVFSPKELREFIKEIERQAKVRWTS